MSTGNAERLPTPGEVANAPVTQKLMLQLLNRPEVAAANVKGEVKQLQAGIVALFQALTDCGIHAAKLEHMLAEEQARSRPSSEAVATDDVAAMDRARYLWHRQCGLDGSRCPTANDCESFNLGFKAALLYKATSSAAPAAALKGDAAEAERLAGWLEKIAAGFDPAGPEYGNAAALLRRLAQQLGDHQRVMHDLCDVSDEKDAVIKHLQTSLRSATRRTSEESQGDPKNANDAALLNVIDLFGIRYSTQQPGSDPAQPYYIELHLNGHGRTTCHGKTARIAAERALKWLRDNGEFIATDSGATR